MTAISSQGVQLKRGNGAQPEVFTSIGQIVTFSGPGGTATVIDATHLGSTAKEKVMGLADEGQLTFDIQYDPANVQHKALIDDRADKVARSFMLVLADADASEIEFTAYVTGFSIEGGVDALVMASVTLEITGAITWPA